MSVHRREERVGLLIEPSGTLGSFSKGGFVPGCKFPTEIPQLPFNPPVTRLRGATPATVQSHFTLPALLIPLPNVA